MAFKARRDFIGFIESIKRRRFVREPVASEFLENLMAAIRSREKIIPVGQEFWRTQLDGSTKLVEEDCFDFITEYDDVVPFPLERMTPLRDSAKEGRANPKGRPCLYLASDRDTAMSEARPWLQKYVSVGRFSTVRQLTLIDFSVLSDWQLPAYDQDSELTSQQLEEVILAIVDRIFSKPVSNDLSSANYLATQIISEKCEASGYDGVIYKSRLGPGLNLALFDLDAARLTWCGLFQTTKVSFEFTYLDKSYDIPA